MLHSNPMRNISSKKITNMSIIGEGTFGRVFEGTWHATDTYGMECQQIVAIKIAKSASRAEVFQERDRMARVDHTNVIRLLGIVQQGRDPPWLIMEYMLYGDLLGYIQQQKHYGGIRAKGMMKIARGIASGMEYLHEQNIIHGDLAGRNCLIAHDFNVKVGDLGYQDDRNSDCYHNYGATGEPCPIRWMPPENLPYRLNQFRMVVPANFKRSLAGDVWAFGIVLFEIWSRGETPFDGKSNDQACKLLLLKSKPTEFNRFKVVRNVRNLMHGCWQFDGKKRPKFSKIKLNFENYMNA